MSHNQIYDARFKLPSSFFVAGSSGSGKSHLIKKLIENKELLFSEPIDKIIWCYGVYQDFFRDPVLKDVDFVQGFNPNDYTTDEGQRIVIIDDLMNELAECKEFINIWVKSRHTRVTPIFLTQNLFFKSGVYRCASLNANYFLIMRMLRDRRQVMTLVHQMFPDHVKFAKEAILAATKEQYSYVVLDTRQDASEELRIRSNIFPEDNTDFYGQYVYIPKN